MKKLITILLTVSLILSMAVSVSAMQVVVVDISGREIILEVESGDTIEALKEKVADKTGIFPEYQSLDFKGTKLKDGRTVADYPIQKMEKINLGVELDENAVAVIGNETESGNVFLNNSGEILTIESDDTVVLYTNDVHCAIDDYPILAAYKTELEGFGINVITVDAGDAIQGEAVGTLTEGSAVVDIMNHVGYDYAVPGNHEYDYGMDVFLNIAQNEAEYEYISSNFCDLRTCSPVLTPYVIENINGIEIAFIGITTPEAVTKSTPEFFKDENGNYIYGFPICDMLDGVLAENIQECIDTAVSDGADFIVAVGHTGNEGVTNGWRSADIIGDTTGIDVFIDAHSHETVESDVYLNELGEAVILSSTGTKFLNFGQMVIDADGTAETTLINPDEISVDNISHSALTAYNEVKDVIERYKDETAYLYEVIGTSYANLVAYDEDGSWAVRKRETNAGDFVADAYRQVTGADIAVVNGGGVRAEISVGDVTRKNLMDINPWNNAMCVIEATGQQVIDMLEHGARLYPSVSGGFCQVSGITYEIDAWKPSPVVLDSNGSFIDVDPTMERRVNNVQVAGEPIDLDATYTLVGSAYMLTAGGDGFTMFEGARVVQLEELPCDSEMLMQYLETLGGKITAEWYGNPAGDGRIVVNEAKDSENDDSSDNENDSDNNTPAETDEGICSGCGEVHNGFIDELLCMFRMLFNYILSLIHW